MLVRCRPKLVADKRPLHGAPCATLRPCVAAGYNVVAIPLAAGVLYGAGFLLSPAAGAVLMSVSTVIVAINARFLRLR